ncbi:hypothetical protein LFM09_36260 [Lentzea alba]|uniref:LiaF transmembrane domain-containing protein n=1 Tax=Lentzea alba TaxID=2714351 RepID=UPI0039BF4977
MTVESGLSGKPVRLWIGLVLLALGTFGVLGAMDVLDTGALVGTWWPTALIGLGVVPMAAQRRVWAGPAVVTVLGLVLLVNNPGWPGGGLLLPSAVLVVRHRALGPARASWLPQLVRVVRRGHHQGTQPSPASRRHVGTLRRHCAGSAARAHRRRGDR